MHYMENLWNKIISKFTIKKCQNMKKKTILFYVFGKYWNKIKNKNKSLVQTNHSNFNGQEVFINEYNYKQNAKYNLF